MRWTSIAALLPLAAFSPSAAWGQRWEIQYFYDEVRTQLELVDLAFPSAERGIAVGSIWDQSPDKMPKPVALITSDRGAHWTTVPLKDVPRSIYFLNDSLGWMVCDNGIWQTEESGRTWKKIAPQKKGDREKYGSNAGMILKVWFVDPQHGFAVGYQKTALSTDDGGKTWKPIEEAAKPTGNPAFTAYTQIAFANAKVGLIAGGATPPRKDAPRYPAWIAPEQAVKLREVPTLTITLETRDASTWVSSTAPLYGTLIGLRLTPTQGVYVFGFEDSFEVPSDVYRLDLTTGQSASVFRAPNRRVTDALLFDGSGAFLAAVEPPGKLSSAPIPGRVKILTSSDLTTANQATWKEMDVDYKAVARALVLAGPDPAHLWAATDTGMILHWNSAGKAGK
ncbi:MAG TPA: YCF48-related protein [Bryobacteraceae bacterium]|nr:YCF48-related protein [Bryobacteraceae bacterium]